MKSLTYIVKKLKKEEQFLKEKFKIKSIGIFGSYVRGENKKKSDIDIVVEFYETIDLFSFVELKIYLEKLLVIKVDLVIKDTIKPRLKDKIEKEIILI